MSVVIHEFEVVAEPAPPPPAPGQAAPAVTPPRLSPFELEQVLVHQLARAARVYAH
jgi:hypothetical protein